MKVISFIGTLPAKLLQRPTDDNKKFITLNLFAQGAKAAGDVGLAVNGLQYQTCDAAVMLGWVHENGKDAPHLRFRKQILDSQLAAGARTVVIDSNLFLYKDTNNPHYYLRYSFDGVFPDTGEYCDSMIDQDRWPQIQRDMNVHLKDYRTQGNHILVCLQRNGGWSMGNQDVEHWAINTITAIRRYSDRPIRVRPHPGDKKSGRYIHRIVSMTNNIGRGGVQISTNTSFASDLKHCWAVVNHNSSPAVGAVIEGIPAFVTDPTRSQAGEVANTDISLIENPVLPDRDRWINRISQFHWSHNDVSSGRCWSHMRQWVRS